MKNRIAIYLSVLSMAVIALSCSLDSDSDTASSYAYIKSFSIGDVKSSYPAITDDGKDTTVVKTISGSSFPFTINQATCEIYNNDSFPYLTNLTKVVVNMKLEGVATIYNAENEAFENFTTSDSIDFTTPRTIRITSLNEEYTKDYHVSVNAHKVEPEKMAWSKVATPSGIAPEKAIQFGDDMLLLGKSSGKAVVASMPLNGATTWALAEPVGLPATVDFSSSVFFNDSLYALADGNLYASADAVNWDCLSANDSLVAIIGASAVDSCLWVANADSLYCGADGSSLEPVSALPENFPLYGVSSMSYQLSHNKSIVRYMLIGYTTPDKSGTPQVWSKLSTENAWVKYDNIDNPYPCPSLAGLSVLRYDNNLYALGGKGKVGVNDVEAFSSFYISKDNGIVWKAPDDYYLLLPKELKGKNIPFVATVDANKFMWIITTDSNVGAWRGIINRLGFSK